jgi:hypothetical protein
VVDVYVYVTATDGWLLELTADTADFPALYLGAEPGATDGYDDNYDELLPGEIIPTRAVRNFAGLYNPAGDGVSAAYYQRDIRVLNGSYVWVMELEAYDEDLTISWDSANLPDGLSFTIGPCDASGTPVPLSVAVDMAGLDSVTATAGAGPAYYCITAVSDVTVEFELDMQDGWNLISLPLKPTDASVDALFGALGVGAGGRARTMRDGSRGRITSDQVWDWDETTQEYVAVDSLEPYQGYWVYVPEGNAATVTITGTPAAEPTTLAMHWNLIGVGSNLTVDNPGISSSIFGWLFDNYFKTSTLVPGYGFWLYAFEADTELVPQR